MKTRYSVHAQGTYGGPTYATKREALQAIRAQVKDDMRACRQRFGRAILKVYQSSVWTVQALADDRGPMWSRYSIHAIV